MSSLLEKLEGNLVVSCQASDDSPLHGPVMMSAMARAAEIGGAAGIRAEGVSDIREISKNVDLPIIGIIKNTNYNSEVYITPTFEEVDKLLSLEIDVVAFDATERERPYNISVEEICDYLAAKEVLSMADISSLREAKRAASFGADIIATTLSGYTGDKNNNHGPDLDLVKKVADSVNKTVFVEGRIRYPEQARRALELGAHSVVVGSAITRPRLITESFVKEINKG